MENLFIDFKSPESVFNYTSSGEINDIFYAKKISDKFDSNGNFDVYNVSGTQDYYIIGYYCEIET